MNRIIIESVASVFRGEKLEVQFRGVFRGLFKPVWLAGRLIRESINQVYE